jgi:hypothetical protein
VEEEVITSEKQRFATYYFSGPANLTIASAMKVTASVSTEAVTFKLKLS